MAPISCLFCISMLTYSVVCFDGVAYRDPDDAGMALYPVLVAFAEERERTDTGGGKELDGQNGVNLADELVSDVDGSLGHRAAKLEFVLTTAAKGKPIITRMTFVRAISYCCTISP